MGDTTSVPVGDAGRDAALRSDPPATPVEPDPMQPGRSRPEQASAGQASAGQASAGQVRSVPVRPARTTPPPIETLSLSGLAGPDARPGADDDALDSAIGAVVSGGTLVVEMPAPGAVTELAVRLRQVLGDRRVLRLAPPGRHDHAGSRGRGLVTTVREPFADLVAALPRPVRDADAVLLVERAEQHLRRGLDPDALEQLRRTHPSLVVVLALDAGPDVAAVDGAGQWLRGLAGRTVLLVGPDAEETDASLDGALAELARRSSLAIDVIEAVAHATAAGRLPDVPVGPVLRLASGLVGGDPAATASAAELADVLDAAEAAAEVAGPSRPLLRCGGTGEDGMPTTLSVDPLLVARCQPGVGELASTLVALLLEGEADDVELLGVARLLAAADDPRPALAALDRLITSGGRVGAEARLLRGVVGDRLGSTSALDDYHAVAEGTADIGLALQARFLLGGLLEAMEDEAAARDAYAQVVASGHPVHAPMAAFNLAWLEERAGAVERAVAGYRTIAGGEHPEAAPMAALNLASLLQRAKRYAESESWFRLAVDSRHADVAPMAAVALGLMLERRQRPREARVLFRYAASSGHEEASPAALRRLGAPAASRRVGG